MGDLKEEIIAKTLGIKENPQETIGEVKKQAENMSVIDETMETAKKLAGTNALSEELKSKDKKVEALEKDRDKKGEELQEARMQTIQAQLGAKIDHLSESIKGGASTKSIGDQISEVKKVASELGLGGSKVSELKDMMNLIESLKPNKGLAEQVKEAKELLETLKPEKGAEVAGIPASVALEMKKMDSNLQITLEQMRDDRQRRDQEFELEKLKWEEDRNIRRQEVNGKIMVERERNEILTGGLKMVGEAAGRAYADALAKNPAGVAAQPGGAQTFKMRAGVGDHGEVDCPVCSSQGKPTKIGIGPTSTLATCVGCNSQFEIERVPVAESPAETPSTEEEEV